MSYRRQSARPTTARLVSLMEMDACSPSKPPSPKYPSKPSSNALHWTPPDSKSSGKFHRVPSSSSTSSQRERQISLIEPASPCLGKHFNSSVPVQRRRSLRLSSKKFLKESHVSESLTSTDEFYFDISASRENIVKTTRQLTSDASPRWLRSRRNRPPPPLPSPSLLSPPVLPPRSTIILREDSILLSELKELSERCGFTHPETTHRAYFLSLMCLYPSKKFRFMNLNTKNSSLKTLRKNSGKLESRQLLLLCVLGLAVKLYEEEPSEPTLTDLITASGWKLSIKKLVFMERRILNFLDWDLLAF